MFKKLLHTIAHALAMNEGKAIAWEENGELHRAFKCDGCRALQDHVIEELPWDTKVDDYGYLCYCGTAFPKVLGVYGCPSCCGDHGPAMRIVP